MNGGDGVWSFGVLVCGRLSCVSTEGAAVWDSFGPLQKKPCKLNRPRESHIVAQALFCLCFAAVFHAQVMGHFSPSLAHCLGACTLNPNPCHCISWPGIVETPGYGTCKAARSFPHHQAPDIMTRAVHIMSKASPTRHNCTRAAGFPSEISVALSPLLIGSRHAKLQRRLGCDGKRPGRPLPSRHPVDNLQSRVVFHGQMSVSVI